MCPGRAGTSYHDVMPDAALNPETMARLAEWQADDHVLGALLVGSKASGYADARSDDDLEVVLAAETYARLAPPACHEYRMVEDASPQLRYDALFVSLAGLQQKAESPLDIDHWPYASARILFDRTGDVGERVRQAAAMPEPFQRVRILHAAVDLWVATNRAAKTTARGFPAAGRMTVVRGAKALTRILFALERRWVPPDHWLEAELPTLRDPHGAVPCLRAAIAEFDPDALAAGLERLEPALVPFGFPLARAERNGVLLGIVHESRTAERAIHALP